MADAVQLRLNAEQRQQKEAAETSIADLQEQLTLTEDPAVKENLQKEIDAGQASLDELMENFAVSEALLCPHLQPGYCTLCRLGSGCYNMR